MNSILIFILVTLSICCINEIKRAKEGLRSSRLQNNETVSKNCPVKALIQRKFMAEMIEIEVPVELRIEVPEEEPDEETPHVPHGHYSCGDSVDKISVNYLLIISGLFILSLIFCKIFVFLNILSIK
jgi:hypothetical protein